MVASSEEGVLFVWPMACARIRYVLWFAELERKQHNVQRHFRVSLTRLAMSKYSGSEMLQGFELDVQNFFLLSRLDWLFNFHIFLYNFAGLTANLSSHSGVPFFSF